MQDFLFTASIVQAREQGLGKKKGKGISNWRNSPITAGIALLVIAFSVYKTFYSSSSGGRYADFKVHYVCTDCREVMYDKLVIGELPPHECYQCDKKEMYLAHQCLDCNKVTADLPRMVPMQCMKCDHVREALFPTMDPVACPECKSADFWEPIFCDQCDQYFPSMDGRTDCPDCGKKETMPASVMGPKCEHCGSQNLGSIGNKSKAE